MWTHLQAHGQSCGTWTYLQGGDTLAGAWTNLWYVDTPVECENVFKVWTHLLRRERTGRRNTIRGILVVKCLFLMCIFEGVKKEAQHSCVETFLQKTVKLLVLVVVCVSLLGGMNKTMSSLHASCDLPQYKLYHGSGTK